MVTETVVMLSRAQFAANAVQYFLFVPLTLGLSLLLVLMESWFAMSGRLIYRDMAQFWGRMFAVGLGVTVVSSLAMAFQFGSHWSYFAHYAGDVFAWPLLISAIGLFVAANAGGWYVFGWSRLTKFGHLTAAWLVCLGCHLSFYGFLMASGWMQNPIAAELNPYALRLEMTDPLLVLLNPIALAKFRHGLLAAYVVAAGFMLAISAYCLLKQRATDLAAGSYRMAAAVGLLALAATMMLGDSSIYGAGSMQRAKLAAINGLPGDDLLQQNRQRIANGKQAYALLQELRDEKTDPQLLAAFAATKADLGYALLLKRWKENVIDSNPAQVEQAAQSSLPPAARLYWGYKTMIAMGWLMLALFTVANLARFGVGFKRWLLTSSLLLLPLPWLASAAGWTISEFGRQPWIVADSLPIWQGVSTLANADVVISLVATVLAYAGLSALAVFLIVRSVKQGTCVGGADDAGEHDHA